jgi:hypothetical protein
MNPGAFKPGPDPRRNLDGGEGRAPSSRSLAAIVRTTLGRDASVIVERVRTLAAAGDPSAINAAAVLLAAAIEAGKAAHS